VCGSGVWCSPLHMTVARAFHKGATLQCNVVKPACDAQAPIPPKPWRYHHRLIEVLARQAVEDSWKTGGVFVCHSLAFFFGTLRFPFLFEGFPCLVVIVQLPVPFYSSRLAHVHCFNSTDSNKDTPEYSVNKPVAHSGLDARTL